MNPRHAFVKVIDSHTGGEPTRVVIEGGPDLGSGPLADRRERFRRECDAFRSGVCNEPRGNDVMVGALLVPPHDPTCDAAVLFFNNVGVLGMCGHGTIGLVITLAELGRVGSGELRIETPVGVVQARSLGGGRASVRNVPSRRIARKVPVEVAGLGTVHGDIAWGGNWFFLVEDHKLAVEPTNLERLTQASWAIRRELERRNLRGDDGGEIDHIELFGPPTNAAIADSRSFVLCPGGAYDRSPCGTGTSAKLACLMADGKVKPGQVWRQQSVVGSVFEATGQWQGDAVIPTIVGSAHITAEATLRFDPADPFRDGIRL